VLRGAVWVLAMQGAAAALSYGMQVLFARWMGVYEYGLYAFAWSLVPTAAAVAAIGMPGAAIRFVPQYLARRKSAALRGLIRRSVTLTLGVGLLAAGAGWLILLLAGPWLADHYLPAMRIALLCIPLLSLILLISDLSRGFGWAGLAYGPQWLMMPGLLVIGVSIYTSVKGRPTATIVLIFAVAACAVTAILHLLLFRHRANRIIGKTRPSYRTKTWLRVAIPLLLSDGVFLLLWSSDQVMLGAMTNPQNVAIYQACCKTAGLTLILFSAVTAFAAPRFAALWLDRDMAQLQSFARSVARWMFLPSLVVGVGIIVIGPWLLRTFGADFVAGYAVLIVLTVGYLSKSFVGPVGSYLAVSGHQDAIVLVIAVSSVLNILMNLVLIPWYGVMGAAAASIFTLVLSQVWQYVLVRRKLGVDSSVFAGQPIQNLA
jgi:O-antigen/teichoic acid export membrane protein